MFLGTSYHKLDVKQRLTIPGMFRKQLPDELVLLPMQDPSGSCLALFAPDAFEQWVDQALESLDPTSVKQVSLRQRLYSTAAKVGMDTKGRVLIPRHLIEYANLNTDVVVLGIRDHLEIWDALAYAELLKNDSDEIGLFLDLE